MTYSTTEYKRNMNAVIAGCVCSVHGCDRKADGLLVHPESGYSTLMCREHGDDHLGEYADKLGEAWAFDTPPAENVATRTQID